MIDDTPMTPPTAILYSKHYNHVLNQRNRTDEIKHKPG